MTNWTRGLLPSGILAAAALVGITTAAGQRAIERATVESFRTERRALAEQGASLLGVTLEAVRQRVRDPIVRAFSGIERARSPEDLAAALRAIAGDTPQERVIFFVHDGDGRLVAVDPAVDPGMAAMMIAHHHAEERGPWREGAGVCPMCAEEQHAVSIVQPFAAPLGNLFLAANVRLDTVGAAALDALTVDGSSSVCVDSASGRRIVCRGHVPGDALRTRAPVERYPIAVDAATSRAAVVGVQRRRAFGMVAASAAALALLAGAGALALALERRRRSEEVVATARMAEMDKFASLGAMAAGVMHEISSPLAYVRANLDSLDRVSGEEAREARVDALEGVERIQRIAEDLRRFSRRASAEIETFDVREPIEAAVRMSAPKTRYACRVDVRLAEPVWVRGNPQHVAQIVLNLLGNAAHALGGRPQAEARVTVDATRVDGRIDLRVEDNGPGVPAEHMSRLFTLFFTTKPAGEGTGLGLALSARMAAEDGGRLRYEPASPGARFVLELPAADPPSGSGV